MSRTDELSEQQRSRWNSGAAGWEKWDGWFDAQSRELTAWFGVAIAARPGMQVLDLACGPGTPTRAVARQVLPGGRVIATDLSPEMVAVAKRKLQEAELTNVEVREMNMQEIDFPADTFDAVTCRFGLMFAPEPERAAREIQRVLKPGGRFALAVWDVPEKNSYFTAIGKPVAQIARVPPPDPKAPSVFRLASRTELQDILAQAGLRDVKLESLQIQVNFSSIEECWQIQTELSTTLRDMLKTLAPAQAEQAREAVFAELRKHMVDGGVRLLATPLVASGTK
jgi:ubiquinone/menaquinone biosynthesis C-methylase UbiE